MTPDTIRARASSILNAMSQPTPDDDKADIAAAFEADMAPVRNAIISALEEGDTEALKGLRALLPHLLSEVNQSPALADHLAHQLGKAFLSGLNASPGDAV